MHEGNWTEAAHYVDGQCGQSCPCCRFEEARERPKSTWLGVCPVCAEERGKKRKRLAVNDQAPRTRRRVA
jgi:hypothetical protein